MTLDSDAEYIGCRPKVCHTIVMIDMVHLLAKVGAMVSFITTTAKCLEDDIQLYQCFRCISHEQKIFEDVTDQMSWLSSSGSLITLWYQK